MLLESEKRVGVAAAYKAGEAGSVITDFSNRAFTLDKMEVLASNGNIHQEMLSLLDLKDGTCEKS